MSVGGRTGSQVVCCWGPVSTDGEERSPALTLEARSAALDSADRRPLQVCDQVGLAAPARIGYGSTINTDPSGCHRLRVTGSHGSVVVSGVEA
jgi:hypothetical protein